MEQEKKLILLLCYFLHVVYDGARGKIHSVITLFFVCFYDGAREKTHSAIMLLFACCL